MSSKFKYILTDIEGTTSSISFVSEVLFPFFRSHIKDLLPMKQHAIISNSFDEVRRIAQLENLTCESDKDIIDILFHWSVEDRKVKALKDVQGIIWKKGYESGSLKGHVYPEVRSCMEKWIDSSLSIGVYSSGSVQAQQLLFKHSTEGNMLNFFKNHFDTTVGSKKEKYSYLKISEILNIQPEKIIFLSDSIHELICANDIGMETIQLCRENEMGNWKRTAKDFNEVSAFL